MSSPLLGVGLLPTAKLPWTPRSIGTRVRLRHLFHYAIEVETARLLPRRELAEALQPASDTRGRWRDHEHVLDEPSRVVHADVLGEFEGVHAQVGDGRRTQLFEWLDPYVEAVGILLQ